MSTRIEIVGPFRVLVDGEERDIPARKHRALVAWLALSGPRSRTQLIAQLWPESDDAHGRESLRHALYRIRSVVGAELFTARGDELGLDEHVRLDVRDLERFATAEEDAALERAMTLHRGPLCAELDDLDAEAERVRIAALAASAAERLAARLLPRDPAAALRAARRAVEIDPYREEAHRLILRALASAGDRAGAAAHYRRLIATLQTELGVAPSTETKAVYASLTQLREQHAAVRRPSLEPPAELVGRRDEYAAVMRVVCDAIDGRGGAALVEGEAGAGKSRLLDEIASVSTGHGLRVLRARAVPAEGALALQLWVDALRGSAHEAAALPAPWPAIIATLLPDVAASDGGGTATPELQRTRLYEAVSRLLAALGDATPTVLFLDDLHHADQDSVHLLHYVARTTRGRRVAFVGAARPHASAALDRAIASLSGRGELRQVALGPLSAQGVAELLARSGVRADDLGWLAPRVARWTAGNPLFTLEALRALIAQGRLDSGPGGWGWSGPVPDEAEPLAPELPPDVRLAILSRVGLLGDEARRLMDLAATIGTHVPLDLLSAVSGRDALGLVDDLRPALDAALLRERRGGPSAVEFAHELIRDATYHQIPSIVRAAIHRRIADALEQSGAPGASVALHLSAAGETARAVDHWLAASREAASRFAHDESARASRDALAALPPSSPRRPEVLTLVGDAETRRGALDAALAAYDDALAALPADAADGRASLGVRIARLAKWYARHPRQVEYASAAAAHWRAREARPELADALLALGWARYVSGDADAALAAGEEARRIASDIDQPRLEAEALHLCIRARWLRGETLADISEGDLERLSARLGDDELTCALYECSVAPALRDGRMERALELAQRELAIARRIGSAQAELKGGEDVTEALLALGRYDGAVAVAEDVRSAVARLDLAGPPSLLGQLAGALALAGRTHEAETLCAELLAAAARRTERPLHQDFGLSAVRTLMTTGRVPPVAVVEALRPTCATCEAEWRLVAGVHAGLRGDGGAALALAVELEASLRAIDAPRLASGPAHIRAVVAIAAGRAEDARALAERARTQLRADRNAKRLDDFERDLRTAAGDRP